MKKKLLILAFLLSINLVGLIFYIPAKAESAYAPYPSNKANILGTGYQIDNTENDYNIQIPSEYATATGGNLLYKGTATQLQMYTTIGSNGIAPVGAVTSANPFVPAGISKPIILPNPPKTINFLGDIKYFQYYVVETVNDLYPQKGNNYAFNAGDTLPTNALFAWAYYSDSPGITINYKTTNGDTLADSITYFGELGDTPNISEKAFDGYSLTQKPQVGSFTRQEQSYDYIYDTNQIKTGNVTVKYVDTLGNEIADKKVLSGNVGDTYQTQQLPIDGYTFKEVSGNTTGTFTEAEQTVTYIYNTNQVKTGNVMVQYVDTLGNEIADKKVLSGNVGDPYQTQQLPIDGYTFKEVSGNTTGTFTEAEQTVTYIYNTNQVKTGNVTVKYVDTLGNEIADKKILSGNVGDPYQTQQLPIDGYTFKEVSGNTTGTFTEAEQTVTYIYSKKNIVTATQNQLPETGEKQSAKLLSLVLGVLCLTVGIKLTVLKRKL